MNERFSSVRTLICVLALAGSLFATATHAAPARHTYASPRLLVAQNAAISRERAAEIAAQASGGRVLSVSRKGDTFHVKVLLRGERVRTVRVDARSGKVKN